MGWLRRLFGNRRRYNLASLNARVETNEEIRARIYRTASGLENDRHLRVGSDVIVLDSGHYAGQFQADNDRDGLTSLDDDVNGPGTMEIRRRIDLHNWELLALIHCMSRDEAWAAFDQYLEDAQVPA